MRAGPVLIALLLVTPMGFAQTGPDASPSATYARAVDLLEANQHAQAAELLEGLVASDPANGRAWFNLALASRALNRPSRAVLAFERAQALDPRLFSRRQRRAMREQMEEMRARCGTLTLAVTPSNAEVRVAGRVVTGGATGVLLDSGTHSVEIRAAGHQPQTREVSITAGAASALTVTLEREPQAPPPAPREVVVSTPVVPPPSVAPRPRLLIDPRPATARVIIDDVAAGAGRIDREVDPGTHVVEVRAEGHQSVTRTVTAGSTGVTRVDVSLSRRGLPGWVVPVAVVGGILVAGGITAGVILGTQGTSVPEPNWGTITEGGAR